MSNFEEVSDFCLMKFIVWGVRLLESGVRGFYLFESSFVDSKTNPTKWLIPWHGLDVHVRENHGLCHRTVLFFSRRQNISLLRNIACLL